jgi:hypothetical protein
MHFTQAVGAAPFGRRLLPFVIAGSRLTLR